MHEFDAAEWGVLADPQSFLRHAFLHALEENRCFSAETGWQLLHLGLWRGGQLAAAIPLYLKSLSYGEYVFGWRWANAFKQAGGHCYPKLLCAIPFTPERRQLIEDRVDTFAYLSACIDRINVLPQRPHAPQPLHAMGRPPASAPAPRTRSISTPSTTPRCPGP